MHRRTETAAALAFCLLQGCAVAKTEASAASGQFTDAEVEAADRELGTSEPALAEEILKAKANPDVFLWTSSDASIVWTWQVISIRLATETKGTIVQKYWSLHRVTGGLDLGVVTEDFDGRSCPPVYEVAGSIGNLSEMLRLPIAEAYDGQFARLRPEGPSPDGTHYRLWAKGYYGSISVQTKDGPVARWHDELANKLKPCGARERHRPP